MLGYATHYLVLLFSFLQCTRNNWHYALGLHINDRNRRGLINSFGQSLSWFAKSWHVGGTATSIKGEKWQQWAACSMRALHCPFRCVWESTQNDKHLTSLNCSMAVNQSATQFVGPRQQSDLIYAYLVHELWVCWEWKWKSSELLLSENIWHDSPKIKLELLCSDK